MSSRLGWRLIVGLVLAALLLLQLARCQGAADAREAREQVIADSAAAAALHRVGAVRRTAQAAGRVYIGTVAPHVEARAATTRQVDRTLSAVAAAEAARAAAERVLTDSSATLKELRVELRRSADVVGVLTVQVVALVDTLQRERAAADARIAAAVAEARALWQLDSASVTLDSARVNQVDVRDAALRRPWWRRALVFTCQGGTTAGGAGLGAMAGGTGGAMVGAVVGLVGGAAACR